MNDEPDVPDFIDAIACALKSDGFGYLEAKSMVEHMFAEAWDMFDTLADLDPPTNAIN